MTYMARHTNDTTVEGVYEPNDIWSYSVVPRPIITWPNGNENLTSGLSYTIRWKNIRPVRTESVAIEYSTNNGHSWHLIETVANTEAYQWTPPAVDSNECLIRILDPLDPQAADTSDHPFTIFQCRSRLVGDINGDCYVNSMDFLLMAENWLLCANPFDDKCHSQ